MGYLEDLFGEGLINWLSLFLVGILLLIIREETVSSKFLGWSAIIVSALEIFYRLKLKFYLSFKKTNKNFKSHQERFISEYLDRKKVKYIYEHPLTLGNQKLHPDFYLPEFDVYVEYWGNLRDLE